MSKKYLGIICLLYSLIFSYVIIFDKLKNYLAPQMQIYLILSILPMTIIGIVLLISKNNHYKFKITDIILVLPLILLILSGDGRLSSSFAINRMTNNKNNRVKTTIVEEQEDYSSTKDIINSEYKSSKADFEIDDTNYDLLSNYLTYDAEATKYVGRTIKVRGFAVKDLDYIPSNYFVLGKYSISCCVADAGLTGFIIDYDLSQITNDKWYEIKGVLVKGVDNDGYNIMYVKVINIKEIPSEEEKQYIYPCYFYNSCNILEKYK